MYKDTILLQPQYAKMRDRPHMNIDHQPKPRISPTRSFHPLRTSTRVPPPYSSASHSTNRASSPLNGPSSNDMTSFGVKHTTCPAPEAARKESSGATAPAESATPQGGSRTESAPRPRPLPARGVAAPGGPCAPLG